MTVGDLINPKIGALLNLMGRIPRPSNPTESVLNGYVRLSRLHDGEPELLLNALLESVRWSASGRRRENQRSFP